VKNFRKNFRKNENYLRTRKFSRNEISRNLLIFAFRENEKTVFVSTLISGVWMNVERKSLATTAANEVKNCLSSKGNGDEERSWDNGRPCCSKLQEIHPDQSAAVEDEGEK
jgi:hypothetical protein